MILEKNRCAAHAYPNFCACSVYLLRVTSELQRHDFIGSVKNALSYRVTNISSYSITPVDMQRRESKTKRYVSKQVSVIDSVCAIIM